MKSPSNYANQQCHAEGEPRKPVLTLNEVKGKDRVVGGQAFSAACSRSVPPFVLAFIT